MLPEFFIALVLAAGTPQQEILMLEKFPSMASCKRILVKLKNQTPPGAKFGCITSHSNQII